MSARFDRVAAEARFDAAACAGRFLRSMTTSPVKAWWGLRPRKRMPPVAAAGLVHGVKRGKEVFFSTTPAGVERCMRYRAVREVCLMPGFSGSGDEDASFGELARLLRTLAGRYDQAARAATSS